MGKVIDITGQRFGRLVVIERQLPNQNHKAMWKCKCDCGNEIVAAGILLRRGQTSSCGCLQKDRARESMIKDLTGQKFNRLLVLEKDNIKKGNYWICKCECGNLTSARGVDLKSNRVQSCGCLQKEKVKEYHWQPLNLIGKVYGKLTVISRIENSKKGNTRWLCKCQCGNEIEVDGSNLTIGNTQSCGCLISKGNAQIKNILQINSISFESEYLIHYKQTYYKYDFAILDDRNNIIRLIEFDGEQHFVENKHFKDSLEIIQYRDKEKNKWAAAHNIPLVRIPYWERDNITLDMILGDKYLIN